MNLPLRIVEVQQLTAPAASVTFSGIGAKVPTGSRHLVLIVNARGTAAATSRLVEMVANGDVGANYHDEGMSGAGAVASAFRNDSQTHFLGMQEIPAASKAAGVFGGGTIVIPHAFTPLFHKVFLSEEGSVEDELRMVVGRWAGVASIDSLTLNPSTGNFATGSLFVLAVVDERYLIQEIQLVADGPVTFSNIPSGSGDLAVVGFCRDTAATPQGTIFYTINGDAVGVNYNRRRLQGQDAALVTSQDNGNGLGATNGDTGTPLAYGGLVAYWGQHGRNGNYSTAVAFSGFHELITPRAYVNISVSEHNSRDALTSLSLLSGGGVNWKAGSLFSLYHVPRHARLIERVVLDAPAASVTFAAIPTDFDGDEVLGLQIHIYARSDYAAGGATLDTIDVSFNADAADANYLYQRLIGLAAAPLAVQGTNRDHGVIPAAGAAAFVFGGGTIHIYAPMKVDRHTHRVSVQGSGVERLDLGSVRWANLAALTSIALSPESGANFVAGSVFELEAIVKPAIDMEHLIFDSSSVNTTRPITYAGTWPTFPIITIAGLATPIIENLTTGEKIELAYDIPVGRVVTIDLSEGQKTVVDDLGTNLIGTVTSDSDLATFHIAPDPEAPGGVNNIRVRGFAADILAVDVHINYYTRYFGI